MDPSIIAKAIPSSSVFIDVEKLTSDTTGTLEGPENRLVWLKEKPKDVEILDKFLRSKHKIPFEMKSIVTIHLPSKKKGTIDITKPSEKQIKLRVIISTISDNPILSLPTGAKFNLYMKPNEAYILKDMMPNFIGIQFDTQAKMTLPAKKGFRKRSIAKKLDQRHIIVIDYL